MRLPAYLPTYLLPADQLLTSAFEFLAIALWHYVVDTVRVCLIRASVTSDNDRVFAKRAQFDSTI